MLTVANAEVTVAVNGLKSKSSAATHQPRTSYAAPSASSFLARSRRTTSCGSATPRLRGARRRGEPQALARVLDKERGCSEPRTVATTPCATASAATPAC